MLFGLQQVVHIVCDVLVINSNLDDFLHFILYRLLCLRVKCETSFSAMHDKLPAKVLF